MWRGQGAALCFSQMQYTFIYQALLEYYLYGDTELDVSSLEKHLQTLHSSTTHFDKIGLEEEFRVGAGGVWVCVQDGQQGKPQATRAPLSHPCNGPKTQPGSGRQQGFFLPGLGRVLEVGAGACACRRPGRPHRPGRPCLAAASESEQRPCVSLTAETDKRADPEGGHEDRKPAGQHEEGQSDPDYPL